MGKAEKTKKFAATKRLISPRDPRLPANREKAEAAAALAAAPVRNAAPPPAVLFYRYNTALGPPYRILLDTNFINFAIKNKLEIVRAAMDCLLAKCIPVVTDCVMAELEKLGVKYRVALRVAKDPRFERLTCTHAGTYADDCIVNRIREHRCYVRTCIAHAPVHAVVYPSPSNISSYALRASSVQIVATCDKDLRRRIRKVPGVPCLFITQRKFQIERFVESDARCTPRTRSRPRTLTPSASPTHATPLTLYEKDARSFRSAQINRSLLISFTGWLGLYNTRRNWCASSCLRLGRRAQHCGVVKRGV